MRRFALLALAGILALVPATAAPGQTTDGRQTAKLAFGRHAPHKPTNVRLAIDYRNPGDPGAKPPAVETVVTRLARGARIDTSVPARCDASDAELMLQGTGACPRRSIVGRGTLSVDTGLPGPGRNVENDVTLLNDTAELIFLVESRATNSVRLVARSAVGRRTTTSQVPPIPGGPPDGFTAIKEVRLKMDRIIRRVGGERRAYIRTPGSCPRRGSWVNRARFTYRDGVSQTTRHRSVCPS